MMAPAFAPSEITLSCNVRAGSNGCPDLVFTARNGMNPEEGVIINVTMDGFSQPFYNGTTDYSGTLVLTGVPAGNYTWTSSFGQNGNVTIRSEDYPIEASDQFMFWLWFMAFKSNATDGEKCRYLLQAIADYFGYTGDLLPPSGLPNNETATLLIPRIQVLEAYIIQNSELPTLGAAKLALYIIKSVLGFIAKLKPATDV
jgi:hypothetical protein